MGPWGSAEFNYSSGCISHYKKREDVIEWLCFGIGCCPTPIPRGLNQFIATTTSMNNHTQVWSFDPCSFAFLADRNQICAEAKKDITTFAYKDNNYCNDLVDGTGYLCSCNKGYDGNPYLKHGCQGM
ncbi:hypothetical protein IFM89_018795 [Coptis chinensis]|uniref:Wall-associated receptor kinase domain-containing protein n=1 Tax=Coptis chinensis TaxID=261450 RepID=A0A835IAI3_9MAGN|nr:hypothetical protein IFM89_018795 [Coptis chinensis]